MKKILGLFMFLLIFGGLGVLGYTLFKDMNGPSVTLVNVANRISPNQEIQIDMEDSSGVKAIVVTVKKGQQSSIVYEQNFPKAFSKQSAKFNLKNTGLKEGDFELEVRAVDNSLAGFGRGNTTISSFKMKIDTIPPRLSILSPPITSARRGSITSVSYNASEDLLFSGVRLNNVFYPAFKQANNNYYCLFPFPLELPLGQFTPEIIAKDLAGNEAKSRIIMPALERTFKADILNISDRFLEDKAADFAELIPNAASNLERYIKINNEVRVANEQTLLDIGKKSAPTLLSEGAFIRLPGSATRATFGDKRTYKYGDKVIDNQTHMGLDLASTKNAPVPAGNHGIVAFADNLGIFGKLVVIDHGLGLMSIYSHLAEYNVQKGDQVRKGDIIGKTGVTGLAGGDHLHFGVLIHGLEIQPGDWFDRNWIKNNITDRLK